MLKQFCVTNYKNFHNELTLDFTKTGGYQFHQDCLANGLIGKMLIYGRNATGKTNLGRAVTDIASPHFRREADLAFLNADSSEEHALFSYTFQFGEDTVVYRYAKSSDVDLLKESLFLNDELVFDCDYSKKTFTFDGLHLIGAETAVTQRFTESLKNDDEGFSMSLLRWVFNNVALPDDSVCLKLMNFVARMRYISYFAVTGFRARQLYSRFFERLSSSEELRKFEHFMNAMGVEGSYVVKQLPDDSWELYFKRAKLIPFLENASSGTHALMDVYRRLELQKDATFLYMDEFDAFYHYEMSRNMLEFFQHEYPHCQIVFTTHNTNLMSNRFIRPDCAMILSRDGRLTALCNATERELREGHNLEKMYISGEFAPYE